MNTDNPELIDNFEQFFKRYYSDEIAELAMNYPNEQRSLHVNYSDLYKYDSDLADDYRNNPEQMQEYAEEALRLYDLPVDIDLADANVRVHNLGEENTYSIGEYSPSKRHKDEPYFGIRGQITKATKVKPEPEELAYECQRCGTLTYIPQDGSTAGEDEPHECQGCERQGPFKVNFDRSEFQDYQKIRVKQPPSEANGGDGATIDAYLRDDIAGDVDPGDLATVNGELKLRPSSDDNETAFETFMDAHAVDQEETKFEEMDITQEDIEKIQRIANGERGDPFELLIDCLAPKVKGYRKIKGAIILQTFEGVRVEHDNDDADRGTIHILLLGDPGTSKSVLLRAAKLLSPRSVYTSGKGATPAGVTATATRGDGFDSNSWSLEAGAFVVASGGRVSFDEIDKTPPEVRSSLHSTLANGKVSVSKAGINTELEAQTSMLAAGNPEYGRFDPYKPVGEQIELGDAMMSRFDLMFMIRDNVGDEDDREVTDHMVEHHREAKKRMASGDHGGTSGDNIPLSLEFIQKWVAYAKQHVEPRIKDDEVAESLKESFNSLRDMYGGDPDAPVPVTRRKLKGLLRLAEASARVRLSEEITMQDINRAREFVGESMRQVYRDEDGNFDADAVETGTTKAQRDRKQWVKDKIRELEDEYPSGAPIDGVVSAATEEGFAESKVRSDIKAWKDKGEAYEPDSGHIMLM